MSCNLVRWSSRRSVSIAAAMAVCLIASSSVFGQTARVLYTWDGTGDTRGWGGDFGDYTGVTFDNNVAGVLRINEFLHGGTSYSVTDDANRVDEANLGLGGLDLYGLDALEFDIGMNNSDSTGVNVAFYVQASPNFDFINIPDILVPDTDFGINTYTMDLSSLTDAQKAHIRRVGFEVRSHTGDASFRLAEVRSVGAGAPKRVIATHEDGTLESGFNGARINFDQGAVIGNDGGANQTGLSVGGGLLTWTDQGTGSDPNNPLASGAAISYQNGQWPWAGNDFESRPHDNTNYNFVTFRMRATDDPNDAGADASLAVQGFSQVTGAYTYEVLADLNLPVDGQFHDVVFPLGANKSTSANNISINLQTHEHNVIVDVDSVIYTIPEPGTFTLFGVALACIAGSRRRGHG
jgi:PEP-CTERM motif